MCIVCRGEDYKITSGRYVLWEQDDINIRMLALENL